MANSDEVQAAITLLRDPDTIRARCEHVLAAGERDELRHFKVDLSQLPRIAALTAAVTAERYPNYKKQPVPIHSRLSHFDADGVPRVSLMRAALAPLAPRERARALLEVIVISVLVDAGSGPQWRFVDPDSGRTCQRSEGLAVASLNWLREGALSSSGTPYAVDAAELAKLDDATFRTAFQVRDDNPLSGVEGRVQLLRKLSTVLTARPDVFGDGARLGNWLDTLLAAQNDQTLSARGLLATVSARGLLASVLDVLTPIWPSRHTLGGQALGDVFPHPQAGGHGPSAGLIPFHKLSQWLSYSLVAPVCEAGAEVVELPALTGLAEYRNGGLFIDGGVLVARDPETYRRAHPADAEVIVEWRALTVALLQRLLGPVRTALFGSEPNHAFPLAAMLEGGTWAAGRRLANERRADGSPPIAILSDGTVF